jgi:Mg2+-importing ATPase
VAERVQVFARVSPMQKNRIILALRARGHVIGCMGDGINDAPALRSADVGISVDSAVDVARDAADIILLEKRLDVLHDGVLEGRRSFGNIMKYVLMGTSSNFGNMLSMAAASLFLTFLPMLPLQILLNNFLYDLAQLGIPSDHVDNTYTLKPKRWNVRFIRRFMLLIGPLSSLYDFATFAIMLKVFHADAALFRTGWFVESLATQTLVIFVIRTAGRPWQSRPSAGLAWGVCTCAVVGGVIPFTRLAPWLGMTPLPPLFFAILVLMIAMYLTLVEIVKRWFYRVSGM